MADRFIEAMHRQERQPCFVEKLVAHRRLPEQQHLGSLLHPNEKGRISKWPTN